MSQGSLLVIVIMIHSSSSVQYGLTRTVSLISVYCYFLLFGLYCYFTFSRNFGVTSGLSWNLNRFEPFFGGLSRLKEMAPYTSMPMMRSNENNIIYSNNMEEKNKLLRELLSENTIEDLRTLVNFKRQMKKPKSTVKRMVDYFKQNSIPLAPQTNMTEVRRAMKSYARAFKIDIVNDRDPLIQLQETREEIGRFLKRLKVEMGEFKYSKVLEVEFYKRIESPKPHKYERGYCNRKQHIVINTHSIQESL